jgi:hypothetical protein
MTDVPPVSAWKQAMPGQVLSQVVKAALTEIIADAWDWLPADQYAEVLP